MRDIKNELRRELTDPEYSEGYAESFLNAYIATQIKVLREQRDLTQSELGALIGTNQSGVSRFEDVNYSAWNIGSLKKLARAFGVRLRVSFETYGTLPFDVVSFGRSSLQRVPREKDPGLIHDGEETPSSLTTLVGGYPQRGILIQMQPKQAFPEEGMGRLKFSPESDMGESRYAGGVMR